MQDLCVVGNSELLLDSRPTARKGVSLIQNDTPLRPSRGAYFYFMCVCTLCDQAEEHILTSCVFARQFWFYVLQSLALAYLMPNRNIISFAEWWRRFWKKVPKQYRKGFNSLCILGTWTLWKHRNTCVFDGATQICSKHSRLTRMSLNFGKFQGLRGLLP